MHCHSCAAPLDGDMKGVSDKYCKHCADAQGNLKPRAEIEQGVAGWLKSWGPGVSDAQAATRAQRYMAAMPAWAKD